MIIMVIIMVIDIAAAIATTAIGWFAFLLVCRFRLVVTFLVMAAMLRPRLIAFSAAVAFVAAMMAFLMVGSGLLVPRLRLVVIVMMVIVIVVVMIIVVVIIVVIVVVVVVVVVIIVGLVVALCNNMFAVVFAVVPAVVSVAVASVVPAIATVAESTVAAIASV